MKVTLTYPLKTATLLLGFICIATISLAQNDSASRTTPAIPVMRKEAPAINPEVHARRQATAASSANNKDQKAPAAKPQQPIAPEEKKKQN